MFTPCFNRKYFYFIVAFALVVCIISSATPHRSHAAAPTSEKTVAQPSDTAQREGAREAYGNINIVFEENRGQSDQRAKFLSRAGNSTLFLTNDGAWFVLSKPEKAKNNQLSEEESAFRLPGRGLAMAEGGGLRPQKEVKQRLHAVHMVIEGANRQAKAVGERELEGKVNYFRGNDPSKWQTDVPTFAGVRYEGVYPGVDLVYYGNEGRELEYDFRVKAGADPNQVSIRYEGAEELKVDDAGGLLIKTPAGDLRLRQPLVYQEEGGTRREISSRYEVGSDGRVSFALGDYDENRELIIDPALVYSTFLGGSGDDTAYGIAVDAFGSAYITGETSSRNFPTTPGAFNTTNQYYSDGFVTKLNASGSALVYSTFLGNSTPSGVAVDASSNAYVTGRPGRGFPTTPGAFDTDGGGVFMTKLNASGSALVYSTYLGGSNLDTAYGISVDASGKAYVVGTTQSRDFPIRPGAFDTTYNGNSDCFVAKIDPEILTFPPTIHPVPVTIKQGRSLTGVTIGTVSDSEDSAGSLAVSILPDGATTTGVTLTNLTNSGGTISADIAATCDATGGIILLHVTDSDSASSTQPLQVRVTLSDPPVIFCPPDITVQAPTNRTNEKVKVDYPNPTVTDDCPGVGSPTCTPRSGFNFPIGSTAVICDVQDVSGNIGTCYFIVTVTAPTGCTITCPANITRNTDPITCSAIVNYPAPTTTGTCGTVTCTPASGSTFPKGTTTVNCSVAGGPSCSFTVTVNDTQNPTINCPSNQSASSPDGNSVPVSYPAPTVSDNCTGVGSPVCTPAPGSNFPVGTTTVNCSVQDAAGNLASCSFTVTVTSCLFNCPASIVTGTTQGQCSAVVNYTTPTSSCGTVTCTPASGSTFQKGTTTVNCSVSGGSSCSFTVTVNDTQNPTITCPQNISAISPTGGSIPITYSAPTVSDNCTGVGSPVCSPASGSNFPVGTTTVNCSVQDAADNSGNCSFTVTITACTLNCPTNIITNASPGQCSATVTYTTPASTCGAVTCSPASGSTFQRGTTMVTCSVSGGPSCNFNITVIDAENPTISCPPNQSATTTTSCAVVNYLAPTASDNCPGVNVVCSPPSGSCFSPGVTPVNCTAIDTSNNTAACAFTVTVTAVTPPTFLVNLPGDDGDGVCDGTCTLRDAIIAANNSSGNDIIGFAPNLTTITLANEIVITNNGSLSINGLGANVLTIDGGPGTNRIFSMDGGSGGLRVGTVTLTGMTLTGGNGGGAIDNNKGGAVWARNASVILDGVNVTGNSASLSGGGIHFTGQVQGQPATTVFYFIRNSTFSNNTTGGGGGGFNLEFSNVSITNSTFTGNTAGNGGGLSVSSTFASVSTLRHLTVTNNSVTSRGGGILSGTINMGNCIVAGNTANIQSPEIHSGSGGVTSVGFNLVGDSAGDAANTGTAIAYQSTDILDTPPLLDILQNNGGPTPTRALQSGSPAIDKGNSFGSTTDQRGLTRPVDDPAIPNAVSGDGADIGAYEVQASAFIGRDMTHSSFTFIGLMDEQSFYKTGLLTPKNRTVSQLFATYLPAANVYALSSITRYLFLTDSPSFNHYGHPA